MHCQQVAIGDEGFDQLLHRPAQHRRLRVVRHQRYTRRRRIHHAAARRQQMHAHGFRGHVAAVRGQPLQDAVPLQRTGGIVRPPADIAIEAAVDAPIRTHRQVLHAAFRFRVQVQSPARAIKAKQAAHVGDQQTSIRLLGDIGADRCALHRLHVEHLDRQGAALGPMRDCRGPRDQQGDPLAQPRVQHRSVFKQASIVRFRRRAVVGIAVRQSLGPNWITDWLRSISASHRVGRCGGSLGS